MEKAIGITMLMTMLFLSVQNEIYDKQDKVYISLKIIILSLYMQDFFI